ncbi:nuclear matrix protein-like protein [Perilla frutescens var. hirtella]|nr:nuclear matrix protein-like protein [Perilla frutescens var. hirtella]
MLYLKGCRLIIDTGEEGEVGGIIDALLCMACTQKEEIKTCEERVKKLLEMTPPKGK